MISHAGPKIVTEIDLTDLVVAGAGQAVNVEAVSQIKIGLGGPIHPVGGEDPGGTAIGEVVIKRVLKLLVSDNHLGAARIKLPILFTEAEIGSQVQFTRYQFGGLGGQRRRGGSRRGAGSDRR